MEVDSVSPSSRSSSDGLADRLRARRGELLAAARRHRAGNVMVFGSVARGEANADSDIDLLVEFEPDADTYDLAHLQSEASAILGARVDVVPLSGLTPRGQRILAEAVPV